MNLTDPARHRRAVPELCGWTFDPPPVSKSPGREGRAPLAALISVSTSVGILPKRGRRCLTAMEVLMDAQLFSPSLKKSVLFAVVLILGVVVIIAAAILLLAGGRLA